LAIGKGVSKKPGKKDSDENNEGEGKATSGNELEKEGNNEMHAEGGDAIPMVVDAGESKSEKLSHQPVENKVQGTMDLSGRLASLRRDNDFKRLKVNGSAEKTEAERANEKERQREKEEKDREDRERERNKIEYEREQQVAHEQQIVREQEIAREQQVAHEQQVVHEQEVAHEQQVVREQEIAREQERMAVREEADRVLGTERTIEPLERTSSFTSDVSGDVSDINNTSTTTEPTKPGGPAEVGPKRSTRVREKGEKIKIKEAEEAAREKEVEDIEKKKVKRKEAKEAKKKEPKDGESAEKKRKDKKRKKDEALPDGMEKKKKSEKKTRKEQGDGAPDGVEKKKKTLENGVDSHVNPPSAGPYSTTTELPKPESKKGEKKQNKRDGSELLSPGAVASPDGAKSGVIPLTDTYLALLGDNTTYPSPIASMNVAVIPDPEAKPAEQLAQTQQFPPVKFDITQRVTSLGRNRQNRKEGEPVTEVVDIDLAIFGQFARAASHLHAYIVHSPPALERNLPEFTLWLVGRNYTKVNGVLHREGIIPVPPTSVFKISKLKLDFVAK